jgi:predicted esterase
MAHSVLQIEASVHGRVLVTPATGTLRGFLLGFHGYAENADVQLERLAAIPDASSWTLVSIQGLNRFYRGRTQDTVASWMTRQDREIAIPDNIRYVEAVVASVCMNSAEVPLVCAGFSQGVAMACRSAVRGRFKCAGIVAVGGDVPPELLEDPIARFPPVLIVRGMKDEWHTQAKLDADVSALEARGVDVQSLVHPDGHEWTDAVAREAGRFLTASLSRDPRRHSR